MYNDPTGPAFVGSCCTCNPPSNCDVNTPKGVANFASFMIAVGSGDPSFRGAFFATQYAWMGFMDLSDKTLQYYLTGASKRPDGVTLTRASLTVFLPRNMLSRVFPSLQGDLQGEITSNRLNVTRNGQLVNVNTISWSNAAQGQFGTTGLLLKVEDVSFSVPIYGVKMVSSAKMAIVSVFVAMMVMLFFVLF